MKFYQPILIVLSVGLFLANFYIYSDKVILFRVAKGFGLNLRVWNMFLYYSMCRSLLCGKLENHVAIHKFIGYIYTAAACGHMVCHLVRTGFLTDQTYITGYTLFLMFLIMLITYALKYYNFNLFKVSHMFYYVWLFICMVHVLDLFVWFLLPAVVFFIEHYMNYTKLQYSLIKNEKVMNAEIPFIYLPVPRKIESIPGSYYYICIPSCGIEWHPYSVASSQMINQLVFLIEVKGDWTTRVYNKFLLRQKENSYEDMTIFVMGPYLTSSTNVLKNDIKGKLCISSGIGITPFLSVIDTKIDCMIPNREYRKTHKYVFDDSFEQVKVFNCSDIEMAKISKNKVDKEIFFEKQELTLIWVFRNIVDVEGFLKYIKEIMTESTSVHMNIYVTLKYSEDEKNRILSEYQTQYIKFFFNRPDFSSMIPKYKSVYYCGNQKLKMSIKNICRDNKIKFQSEIFC